ncbi:MAG TPA: hypothetical protein VF228_21670 [Iamia sp.]
MTLDRATAAWRVLDELPVWFVLVAVVAGIVAAVALRATDPGRPAEALGLVTVGVVAAGAALPDTEVVALAVLVLALGTVVVAIAPPVPAAAWTAIAALAGLLTTWALLDGGRGRPGTVLLAPVVVAPVVAGARWPGRCSVIDAAARLTIGLLVGVATARLTGLGDGTLRPAVGGLVGAVVVAAGLRAWAARRTT